MKKLRLTSLFLCLCLAFFLVLAEFAMRVRKGGLLDTQNTLYQPHFFQANRIVAGYPEDHHSRLGWAPKPNATVKANWGGVVTTEADGIRSNGNPVKIVKQPILAVGGSFTFGDQVQDHETWPAHLEKIAGRQVLNAGVSGYGYDQAILRLESLFETYPAETAVLAITPQNLPLVSFSQLWGLNKPYFEVAGGKLNLKNVPVVPRNHRPELDPIRASLGHSYAISSLFHRLFPGFWTKGLDFKSGNKKIDTDWKEVACALTSHLEEVSKSHKRKTLVVLQYSEQEDEETLAIGAQLAKCIAKTQLAFLDTYPALLNLKNQNPKKYKEFFSWHMTGPGNEFIAQQIFEKLNQL